MRVAPRITSKSSELPVAYHIKHESSALPPYPRIKLQNSVLPTVLVPNTPVKDAFTDTVLPCYNKWDTNNLTLSAYVSSSVSRVPETELECATASCGLGGFLMLLESE